MSEHVLAVARAVVKPAEQLRQLGMQGADAGLEDRLLADLLDVVGDLRLGLVEGLLDPRRMDPAVLEQLLERQASNGTADAVEARQDHGRRRVVDDEVDPRQGLERADVAALAPDDAPLHLVRLERDDRDGGLRGVAPGHPLHDGRKDAARATVGVAAGLLLHVADQDGALVAQLVLELLEEDLLRLADAEPRDPLELLELAVARPLQLLALMLEVAPAVLERALTPLHLSQPDVERLLLPEDALLSAGELHSPLAQLVLDVAGRLRRGRLDALLGGGVPSLRHCRRHWRGRGHGGRHARPRGGALDEQHDGPGHDCGDHCCQHDFHFRCLRFSRGARARLSRSGGLLRPRETPGCVGLSALAGVPSDG